MVPEVRALREPAAGGSRCARGDPQRAGRDAAFRAAAQRDCHTFARFLPRETPNLVARLAETASSRPRRTPRSTRRGARSEKPTRLAVFVDRASEAQQLLEFSRLPA